MVLLTAIVIIIVVLIVLGYPFFRGRLEESSVESYRDRRLGELLSRKEALYSTLKELDFDFKTDKLSREDYKELEEQYRKEALSLLKEIDKMEKGEDAESLIEKEILFRRKTSSLLNKREGEGKSEDIERIIEEKINARRKSCSNRSSGYDKNDNPKG